MERKMMALLFSDVSGYSNLSEPQLQVFMERVLPDIALRLDKFRTELLELNTWGDAIVIVSPDPYQLARFALDLRDFYRNQNWVDYFLPSTLSCRIALHAGAIFIGDDPIRKTKGIVGTQINLAARIEPITEAGQIWVTDKFMGMITPESDPTLAFDNLGNLPLAKQFGSANLWRLRRNYELPHNGDPPPRKLPPVWNVPHHRNPNFIGRDNLLDEIRTSFTSHTTTIIQALHGLGGIGKTQLAIEYAYRYADKYSYVWWLRSEEPSTLITDYIKLGKPLGLATDTISDQREAVRQIRQRLEATTGWLLIFDNATDSASLHPFIPQGVIGHTIITSRNPSWGGLGHAISISTLEREDSAGFIVKTTGQADLATADELAAVLGDLPLALAQATAYIERTGISLVKYLELFRLRRKEVQRQEISPENYPDTVATTWLINIRRINSEMPGAIELLNLISFLGPDAIPLELLKRKPSLLPPSLALIMRDDLEFNSAIVSLRSYSLLNRFGKSISLHRLVQAVTRDQLSKDHLEVWATVAIQIVRGFFPFDSDKRETWDACALLLPHALVSASHATRLNIELKAASWLLNQAGMYLQGIGNFEQAEDLLERALAIADGKIGDTEYDRLR